MSAPHPILIYAELLSNIRQVSVACSLHTPSSSGTRAVVSSDGLVLTIDHDGVETSIRLPGKVTPVQQLPVQSPGAKRLSWRLPLATDLERHTLATPEDQTVPWSASDLRPASSIACRICRATIVEPGVIKIWKDLPSENWAEMMEFWHCHKPHKHDHEDDDNLTSKAYGASSRISAQAHVGFVDLTSFLLSEKDISAPAITTSDSKSESGDEISLRNRTSENGETQNLQPANLPIFCKSCGNQLGVLNDQGSSASLFKWQVYVDERAPGGIGRSPSLAHCISAMLLATMARSGCSKSIILPMKVQDQPAQTASETNGTAPSLLNLWVFNSNITFSSTKEAKSPIKAIKVFYRMVSQEEADKMLDSMTSDVQDITLPGNAIEQVSEILSNSNHLLPESDRQLKNWQVSLLEKWDGNGR
ncbi:ubiquitin-conjugating enzyme E2-binding protein [Hypomontagnella submonticulosa]|nr:ubiquitin-conjugating enzyme E2-binding protein [Hypomontagnella submonticulosa]